MGVRQLQVAIRVTAGQFIHVSRWAIVIYQFSRQQPTLKDVTDQLSSCAFALEFRLSRLFASHFDTIYKYYTLILIVFQSIVS